MEEKKDVIYELSGLYDVSYDEFPPEAIESAKKLIIDILATTTAGSTAVGVPDARKYYIDRGGKEVSSVFVYGDKLPAPIAAQVNAMMGHSRDWDDTLEDIVVHETVTLIPTTFATAEKMGNISGKDFLKAIICGVDVESRIGYGADWSSIGSGWNFTSLLAYPANAMTASFLMGQDLDQRVNAAGITLSQVGGVVQAVNDSVLTKRMQPSFASYAGVQAAELTEYNITGCRNVLEGPAAYYNNYFRRNYHRENIVKDLGTFWHIVNLSFKVYPCCRFTHTSIDATRKLREKYGIKPEEVTAIKVGTNHIGYDIVCSPVEVRKNPQYVVHAQFSIPFTVASALVNGTVDLNTFEEANFNNPVVRKLCAMAEPYLDDEIVANSGDECPPARVTIETTRGTFEEVVWHASGSIEEMIDMDQVVEKYMSTKPFSAYPVKDGAFEEIVEIVKRLEELDNVQPLLDAVYNAFDRS